MECAQNPSLHTKNTVAFRCSLKTLYVHVNWTITDGYKIRAINTNSQISFNTAYIIFHKQNLYIQRLSKWTTEFKQIGKNMYCIPHFRSKDDNSTEKSTEIRKDQLWNFNWPLSTRTECILVNVRRKRDVACGLSAVKLESHILMAHHRVSSPLTAGSFHFNGFGSRNRYGKVAIWSSEFKAQHTAKIPSLWYCIRLYSPLQFSVKLLMRWL